MRRTILCALIAAALLLPGCAGGRDTSLSETELSAAHEILGTDITVEDITGEALKGDLADLSVQKVARTEYGFYVFTASPVGYNGPIDIMLVIDGTTAQTRALKILDHKETDHYVRDFENEWFTGRYAGKSVFTYLETVKLEAKRDNEIVAITGSTITAEGVTEGVNDCFEIFRSLDNPFYEEITGVIELKAGGESVGDVTLQVLEELESYRRKLTIHSSAQGDTVHDFRGARMRDALEAAVPGITDEYSTVIAVGTDGYAAELTMEEIMMENNVFIMYEDGGEPIVSHTGKEGALRLIILEDSYGQRFTNFLSQLEFIKE